MSLFPTRPTQAQAYELDVSFASGRLFFCRRVPLPSDLESGEEGGAALLELEGLSPFPLEHLNYGYVVDDAKRFAFVYAAYKRRFDSSEVSGWRQADAVLPEFAVALDREERRAEVRVLISADSLMVFEYDEESELPARFMAESDEGEDIAERLKSAKRWVSEKIGPVAAARASYWLPEERGVRAGGSVGFMASELEGSRIWRTTIGREALWKCDIRDEEVVDAAIRNEKRNAVLWKAVMGIAALAALVLVGEIFWGAGLGYLAWRNKEIENQQDQVFAIDRKQATSETLRRFQDSNLVPFQMIEALAPYQSWPEIIYRRMETEDPTVLIIDARASNRTQVTEFKRRLEGFGKVQSVELSKQTNNPSGSTFTATIRFHPGSFFDAGGMASNE